MENKIKDFLPNVFGYDTIKKQLIMIQFFLRRKKAFN